MQHGQPANITIVVSTAREDREDDQSRRLFDEKLERLLADRFSYLKIVTVGHLYDLDPDGPALNHLHSTDGELVVLSWLSRRAARWLLEDAGIKSGEEGEEDFRRITCFDLRDYNSAEDVIDNLTERVKVADASSPDADGPVAIAEVTRDRWYPIIDFDRCVNCLECLDFCLFGVFDLDASGRIAVLDADACRNGCPACARVCPSQAIMFPHHENPAVAGDIEATAAEMGMNLVQLSGLGGPGQLDDGQLDGGQILAQGERENALAEKDEPAGKDEPAEKDEPAQRDDLDKLVDELDEMDL